MAPRTRFPLLAIAMLALAVVALSPTVARAQGYSISFTVAGLAIGVTARYYVDNVLNGTIGTGETRQLSFANGTRHVLSVDLNVSWGNGTRYQCRDNVWSFTEAGTQVFTYKAQYRLEVASPYGSPSGTDWYDEGATVNARLTTNVTAGPEGERYAFVRWEGDASGQGETSDPIIIDRAKKAVALWKTQYRLQISSDPAAIFSPSSNWYDEGSLASFSAVDMTNGTDARYVFSGWAGDYNDTGVQGSLRMDGPRSAIAKYKAQYLLTVVFTPSQVAETPGMPNSTWYEAGESVKLGPVPQYVDVSSTARLALISWNVDGATQPGASMDVAMDGPHRVELLYRTQYYLEVKSDLGTTTGTGWYFTGEKADYGVTYSGSEFPAKYTLADWRITSSSVTKTVGPNETELIMDHPYSAEAEWKADYTPMWSLTLVIVSVVIVIVAVVVIAVKRPESLRNLGSSFRSGFRRRKVAAPSKGLPIPTSWVACQKCGARVSVSAEYCQSCGAVQVRGHTVSEPDMGKVDERVYEYIVAHGGEISLSGASRDLGLSADEFKRSTERLKKKGRLA
jgi:hypothetical protein